MINIVNPDGSSYKLLTVEELEAFPPIPIPRYRAEIRTGIFGGYIELIPDPNGLLMTAEKVLGNLKEFPPTELP